MSSKKTEIIYLRLPKQLRKMVEKEAQRNLRTITQQIQWHIEHSLWLLNFNTFWYENSRKES